MAIAAFLIAVWLPHDAYSDFTTNNKYLIQATGFVAGTQNILDSSFDIQMTTGSQSGTNILSTLDNGLVTINGDNYLNTGSWTTTLLREGKYLLLQGNATDLRGNTIQINLFGRQIDSTQNGLVYSITGKITTSETLRVIYSAKITLAGQAAVTTPTSTQGQTAPNQTISNAVRISIVSGASNSNNQIFFSPSIVSVSPGTTIIWTNNDSVPHRIVSGVASPIRGNNSLPIFSPDGMIDSGVIPPGKSFQYTITNFNLKTFLSSSAAQYLNLPQDQTAGDITLFDQNYTWMIGVISPAAVTAQAKSVQIDILQGASTATTNLYFSPSSVQITPGTTVVWKNDDSVPHRILTGQSQGIGGGGAGPQTRMPVFNPDGRIDSGSIAPGQTFQYTVTGLGVFSFYDSSNTWLNGNIISVSQIVQNPPVQVSILQGSSLPQGSASQQNQFYANGYYSPDQIQISPGTTIIWTNNDNVAHSIFSGTATFSTTNPYIPDGKIKSGPIAPGHTFQITINETGMIRFYDPSYTWMNGIIVSIPTTQTKVLTGTPPSNLISPSLH